MAITIESLAAVPRWPLERTLTLPGRSRGDLLGGWGDNVIKRFGPDALARVRRRLPASLQELAPVLTTRDWVPVFAQLVLTEAIVDEHLAGDMLALYPLLVADTRAGMGRVQLAIVRALGPARALRLAPRQFEKTQERGSLAVEIDRKRATLRFRGSPLFEHPSWRVLQVLATRVLLELTETPGTVVGEAPGPETFDAIATW